MKGLVARAGWAASFAMSVQAAAHGAALREAVPEAAALAGERQSGWSVAEGKSELLAVRINDVDQEGEVLALRVSAHSLAVPVAALAQWRLRRPDATLLRVDGQDHIALDSIAGVRWHVDESSQTLIVQVPSSAFVRNDFEIVGQTRPAQMAASLGGFVNYDLHWQRDGGGAGLPQTQTSGGFFELGAFNAYGNGRSTGVWRESAGTSKFTRLDTSWNIDMPERLSSLRVGDAIGVAGAWGRSVRFGGVQWATNFAVQPGLVSFPMPAVRGEASVPSIVDLYVNNAHQLQGKLPPGAFDLPDVPVVTGAGQIRMVVRDLLGREQVVVQPYYVSPALLREGLHDFALEAGTVREDYGLASRNYGRAMLAATDRAGVSDTFTRELRAEVLRHQQTFGVTGVWLLRQFAVASLSAAASRGDASAGAGSTTGWLASAGVERQASDWSAGIQARATSRDFVQVGQAGVFGQTQRSMVSANVSTSAGGGGIGLNLLQQSTWQGDRYRSLSINYGRSVSAFGYLGVFASRTGGSSSATTVGINLIALLGAETSASVSSYVNRSRRSAPDSRQTSFLLQGNAPAGPGFGYRLQADSGDFARLNADTTWQTENAAFTAGAAQANGAGSYRAGVSGGFAAMPEGVFASRRIDGSFAVVQVGDYEGVRVLRDNQFIARTDDKGRAFVGSLRGFESNRISVESDDLPLDAQVDELHVHVVPGMGSGVSVLFPVRRSLSATLQLVTDDGLPVPAGSWVRVGDGKREFPVGFDGKVFLAGIAERSQLRAEWNGRRCEARIEVSPIADAVSDLGVVACR